MKSLRNSNVAFTNDLLMASDSAEYSVLVLLDLRTAFDTTDYNVLIDKKKIDCHFWDSPGVVFILPFS